MVSTNAPSLLLLEHDQNGVCNRNIRLIKELIRLDDPAGSNFKGVSAYTPNLTLLTKSATPGEIQVTFSHASVGKQVPWEICHRLLPRGIP